MPGLIRHPETLESTGFGLEFIPMKIGAGMTPLYENLSLWTDSKYHPLPAHGDLTPIFILTSSITSSAMALHRAAPEFSTPTMVSGF
jgi:hypothetical protein